MKIKKGMFRIYIAISILWSAFWFLGASEYGSIQDLFNPNYLNEKDIFLLIMTILPLPLYFALKWILKGFEK
jgi:hypothetical protein